MLIKSFFIGVYPVVALGLFASIFVGEPPTWLIGFNLLALLPFPLFLAKLFLYPIARTSENLRFLFIIPSMMILLSVIAGALTGERFSTMQLPLISMIVALAGNLLYVFWYSRFGRAKNTLLEIGKKLPDFVLKNVDGHTVSAQQIGSEASLIMFYRGNWCPLCMAQIKEVAGQYKELEKRGIKIYMVSPQSQDHTESLSKRFDVNMEFLIDEESRVAESLQIKAPNGLPMGLQALGYDSDTVMPTVVMTDSDGNIIFADLTDNYRVRPEPEDFLKVLDAHQART
jgi:peroxiredoxin